MNHSRFSLKHHTIIGVTKAISISLVIIIAILNPLLINPGDYTAAQSPCGDSYIVLPGDTLAGIAELCGTTVNAILDINPEITDPDSLYPGQIIRIPLPDEILETLVAISPTCGTPGSSLLVVGSGFPENTNIQLRIGKKGTDPETILATTSDDFGRIDTSITLPSSAEPGTTWVITGEVQISSAQFVGVSNDFSVISTAPNPNSSTTYLTQEGDTLFNIAAKFNRELESILSANPQISGATRISPGQIIFIPAQESGPVTRITPICGPIETQLLVNGDGFPPATSIDLSIGRYLVSYEPVGTTSVSPSRTFQTQLTLPTTAKIGEYWVVVASSSSFRGIRSTSNIFIVTKIKDPNQPTLYIVKPGDTLNAIAAQFTQTVASLLLVNPQIRNPNQLSIGEKILIPGQRETIIISPVSGPPLTTIETGGLGFPPLSTVFIGLSRNSVAFSSEGPVNTDVNGFFRTNLTIPSSARTGDIWTVVGLESNLSGSDVITRSNEFTVTSKQPLLEPNLSIWPLQGPPGSKMTVVGSNFPSFSEVSFTFGIPEQPPFLTSSLWTEINGTFAIDLIVPLSANAGENWQITAESAVNPQINTTSQPFLIAEP
ncbi:MAG: LysM peptidoglycan-binding domain-containing protein [Chloroflexota bacterium]|nr:MAG: LysM peptidoglycan-binding domain-containing protein [Chloroflexota bacterium]